MSALRDTLRYQYATQGVRGPNPATPDGLQNQGRRGWLARLGHWKFGVVIEFPEPVDQLTTFEQPQRIHQIVRIIVRYKGKSWVQQYIIPEMLYGILVSARAIIREARRSIVEARFLRGTINKSEIRITVKRKEDN